MMHFQRYVNGQCDGCGHPIRMGQRWTGDGFAYLYFDGADEPYTNQALTACPACGHVFPTQPTMIVSGLPTTPLHRERGASA